MRSNIEKRSRSIRQLTGTSFASNGTVGGGSLDGGGGAGARVSHHIASGQFGKDGGAGTVITRRYGEPASTSPSFSDAGNDFMEDGFPPETKPPENNNIDNDDNDDDADDFKEDAVLFPQSTHSFLFTQKVASFPFWFAIGIVALSYTCLILALLNIFEDGEPGNVFNVPHQVKPTVRIAQYLALVIALIMEEEIPTGLYLLRMISKESLYEKFPKMKFGKFVFAAFVRLLMGYLFLFNTFLVVAQATAVLDIFYDVLALQFLQQLDDISFNLAKIDVFGQHLKSAALAKCFRSEFAKERFTLRKRLNLFLRGVYFLNLSAMLVGMVIVTINQTRGTYHAEQITVTFGEQVWNNAIVTTSSGDVKEMTLLFSYFNGVYRRDPKRMLNGSPIYVEQNKFDSSPYEKTIGAEISYCKDEKAWVFSHKHITKKVTTKSESESECDWLIRSPETSEFNVLDVTGDWTIWTGSLQQNGHVSMIDNECHEAVDCNYNGKCIDGICDCSEDNKGRKYFGTRCEHRPACTMISGGKGGIWDQIIWSDGEMKLYQRPVYRGVRGGLPGRVYQEAGANPATDAIFLAYSGSRWFGTIFREMNDRPRSYWRDYAREYHAFWEEIYSTRTKYASDPTTESSVIGIDFYTVGEIGDGEVYGTFGKLFPLNDPKTNPKGSGYMRCVESDTNIPPEPSFHINYLGYTGSIKNNSSVKITLDYEIGKDREYESDIFAKDCESNITGIDLDMSTVRSPYNDTDDLLSLTISLQKSQLSGSNLWNALVEKIEICHIIRMIFPAVDVEYEDKSVVSYPKMILTNDTQNLDIAI